jgi:hypothetical protein
LPVFRPEDWFFYVVEFVLETSFDKAKEISLKIQHILVAEASGYSIGSIRRSCGI